MLELVLLMDYESLAGNDPLQFTIKDPAILSLSHLDPREVHISQYISLVEEYVTHAIIRDEPKTVKSIMADTISASSLLKSKHLKSSFYTKKGVELLELEYDPEKAPLVKRIQRLYDVFACLAASSYVPAELPKDAELADTFTSHHSQFFIFDTPDNAKYVQFTKDDKTISYQLTSQEVSMD